MRDNRPPAPPLLDDAVESARQALVDFGVRMIREGLAVGTAGNLSVKAGDLVVITPTGVPYQDLSPSDICSADQLEEVRAEASRRSYLGAAQ
jgi:ribulose-5-phosphate 4-epimerase/fuculose-1-phosphate aldolase